MQISWGTSGRKKDVIYYGEKKNNSSPYFLASTKFPLQTKKKSEINLKESEIKFKLSHIAQWRICPTKGMKMFPWEIKSFW